MKNMFIAYSLSLACIGVSACASPVATKPLHAQDIGWLDGNCLATPKAGLAKGTKLTVIALGTKQSRTTATVAGPAVNPATCDAIKQGRKAVNTADGNSFYQIHSDRPIKLGIGLLHPSTNETVHATGSDVQVDGKGAAFAYCLSSEGIHYSIWSGAPYKSTRLWHAYEYLGYDTQADCPDGTF